MVISALRTFGLLAVVAATGLATLPASAALPAMTADQVVEKNVAARGGLAAWRGVTALAWNGKMAAGGSTYAEIVNGKLQTKERPEMQLPFRLELKRPNRTRLELEFQGTKAVQIYDGGAGWKLRPYLGRKDPESFTADEIKQVQDEPGIDGYLIDFAARGAKVELSGTEKVGGRDCYRLLVTSKGGRARRVWVDGQTFLDAKIEGEPRRVDARMHPVAIFPSDFRPEKGLMIPHVLETEVQGAGRREKTTIESVEVNPKLDDARFTKASLALPAVAAATKAASASPAGKPAATPAPAAQKKP
jgi:outer membrane lipoprotein-sorting protein